MYTIEHANEKNVAYVNEFNTDEVIRFATGYYRDRYGLIIRQGLIYVFADDENESEFFKIDETDKNDILEYGLAYAVDATFTIND